MKRADVEDVCCVDRDKGNEARDRTIVWSVFSAGKGNGVMVRLANWLCC